MCPICKRNLKLDMCYGMYPSRSSICSWHVKLVLAGPKHPTLVWSKKSSKVTCKDYWLRVILRWSKLMAPRICRHRSSQRPWWGQVSFGVQLLAKHSRNILKQQDAKSSRIVDNKGKVCSWRDNRTMSFGPGVCWLSWMTSGCSRFNHTLQW